MKKILLLIPTLKNGGAEIICRKTATLLSKNTQVHIFLLNPTAEKIQLEHVTIHNGKRGRILTKLFILIIREKYSHVYSFMERANCINIIFNLLLRYTPIISIHTAPTDAFKNRSIIKSKIPKIIYYIASLLNIRTVAVSRGIRDEMIEKFKMRNIRCVYNPLNTQEITIDLEKSKYTKIYNPNKTIIGFFGRLVEVKGINVILNAAAQLSETERDKLQIVFVGDGALKRKIKSNLHELKIEHNLIPFTDKIYNYISTVDIVLIPSFAEGFSLVTLESIYFNKFIIYSDCRYGPRELIQDVFKYENAIKIHNPSEDHKKSALELSMALKEVLKLEKIQTTERPDRERLIKEMFSDETYLNEITDALFN